MDLVVDVNCAWTVNQALAIAEELLPLKLKWLEARLPMLGSLA